MKRITGRYVLCCLFTFFAATSSAQNDNCANASVVAISNSGFGTGIFTSTTNDLTTATVQPGETFAPAILVAGQNQKSIWYKFTIPTTRSVRVTLAQPGSAITAGDAGFAVYKINTCLPTIADISTKLTPIDLFGNSYHPCVEPGEYLVQVSGKSSANGPVYVQVQLTATVAAYDNQVQAYDFATLAAGVRTITYDVDCQSTEDVNEVCSSLGNYTKYNKSTWHVFRTPAYFDYIAFFFAHQSSLANQRFGYTLYRGDVRVASYSTLPIVDGCDSLETNTFYAARKIYKCEELDPNTTYSIQLFFHENFFDNVKVALATTGLAQTQAPEPILSAIPAPTNNMGILPSSLTGITTTTTDYHGCNSRHSIHPCNTSLPANGVFFNNLRYNLSSFFTFNLSTVSDLSIWAPDMGCGPNNLLVRLYKQKPTNNCTDLDAANIISEFTYSNSTLDCLDPGDYTIQVLGRDTAVTTNYSYGSFVNTATPLCLLSNLGQRFQLNVNVRRRNAQNKYSLKLPGAFDSINVVAGTMQPLVNTILYNSHLDTFGCANTVLPWDTSCSPTNRKALYREFIVADSGIIAMTNANALWYKLYQGDANALSIAQNAHTYPQRITGLTPYSQCLRYSDCGGTKVCLVPGTYTYATFGGDANVGQASQPAFKYNLVNTVHNSPAVAEDMGDILSVIPVTGGSVQSGLDYFSCKDNAVPINGYQPCTISSQVATKAIYRQFYLSAPANIAISGYHTDPTCGNQYGGYMTMFSGRATDGLAGLTPMSSPWQCFLGASTPATTCSPNYLPAGWYTIVSYGTGPTYSNPFQQLNRGDYGSYIGQSDQIRITMSVVTSCPGPKYNRPYKAAVDSTTGNPFLIQWGPRAGHTAAYPKTDTLYTLYRENFNCTVDTPFSAHPIPNCNVALTKVAYYVFRLTQESYVQIDTDNFWGAVYAGNARTDSMSFANTTPIQSCLQANGQIQICKLQPGDYTLVVFATTAQNCHNVTPKIYIDKVGYSRFDHANNAYDFGIIPSDSTFYNGKPGDINPLDAGRTPSNDFFYCTTGAQATDPTSAACFANYLPSIYNPGVNNALYTTSTLTSTSYQPRRNLWYTFVINQQGTVRVRVNNKTLGKLSQYPFAIYKSNADGTLPFATLVATGQVDSTLAQGLTLIGENIVGGSCASANEIVFTTTASCLAERYYILVENRGGDPNAMNPNSQAEVQVLFSSLCPGPKYNRPHKAAIDINTGNPFLVQWGPRVGHTSAYPKTDTTYTLPRENFNCTVDTPFVNHPIPGCNVTLTKVAYYVFRTTQESYVQIDTKGFWGAVYAGNARTDSASFATTPPVQTCLQSNGLIQLCKLLPGDYTLVVYATSAQTCTNVIPTLYIDRSQYSRFDHAVNAYDFGSVRPDSIFYSGKPGDINPLDAGRPASSDFFYCTTGAQSTDPTGAVCREDYWPAIYTPGNNIALYNSANAPATGNIPRRNLWYTFVISQGGDVRVRVTNKTLGKLLQHNFAVYKSNADGTLPFATLVSTGQVDSTLAQGLALVDNNNIFSNCSGSDEIRFTRERCNSVPERYYIVVENRWDNAGTMKPASQIDVSILYDSVNAIQPLFDHYSQASNIGTALGTGTYTGQTDNFSCATRDVPDPIYLYTTCNKTLWYKFSTTVTGHIRFRVRINNGSYYTYNYIQLFKEIVPGDSSVTGLQIQNTSNSPVWDASVGAYWGQTCVSPGNYYIILPGCSMDAEYAFPIIQIMEEAGDFCSAPVVANLNGTSTNISSVLVDCHTIGTDYGEFNPTLTCPLGGITAAYKTSWFRIDITGTDTLDVTTFLTENTNALPSEIKYRLMNGNCGAMQERSCVQDALTQDTYKCLAPGSYYVQVFTPIVKNGIQVTGTINLNLSAVLHADTCAPINNCLANANFTPLYNCNSSDRATFTNYSTYGSSISNLWDFGYNGQTSTAVSPQFTYPALATTETYTVRLIIQNNDPACLASDTAYNTITIPARPYVNLGNDTSVCQIGGTLLLNATSWPGSTYLWNSNSTNPTYTATTSGSVLYWAAVTFNGCTVRDTIRVSINPLTRLLQTRYLCGNDSVLLNSYRGWGETYAWSTGSSNYFIYAKTPGLYINTLTWNGCTISDTFNIIGAAEPFSSRDTTVCHPLQAFTLNAATPGAQSYLWQNNATTPTLTVSNPGLYWVRIWNGTCYKYDTINVRVADPVITDSTAAAICEGQAYTLPWGTVVSATGVYRDTLRGASGCDSLRRTVNLSVQIPVSVITSPVICEGQTYTLPWGDIVSIAGVYEDTLFSVAGCDSVRRTVNLSVLSFIATFTNAAICEGSGYTLPWGTTVTLPGTYADTLRSVLGCDSIRRTVNLIIETPSASTTDAVICEGQTYILPWGTVVSATGIYRDTLRSVLGCDSLRRTVNLSVEVPVTIITNPVICQGQTYTLPWGTIVNTAGVYEDTLFSTAGCDSVRRTVNLTVQTFITTFANAAICEGSGYTLPWGITVTVPGTYTDTLRTVLGCDSIRRTISLVVETPSSSTIDAVICEGAGYTLPWGDVVSVAGIYSDTLRSVLGCDSLRRTVNLSVQSPSAVTISAAICEGSAYTLPWGTSVTAAGIYRDTLYSAIGCDSVRRIVNLIVESPVAVTINAAICEGAGYILPWGVVVTTAGTYRDTLQSVLGCDSLRRTVILSVETVTTLSTDVTICEGAGYALPWGTIATVAGTYRDTLQSISGCDSIRRIVNLIVETPVTLILNPVICEGSGYTLPWETVVTSSGIYRDTLRSVLGCDSIRRIVNLTVESPAAVTINAVICEGAGYTLPWGVVVNTAGVYRDTLYSLAGCDSLHRTINLSLQTAIEQASTAVICNGTNYTLPWGAIVNTAGIYRDTLRTTIGCDSIRRTVTLSVEIAVIQTINPVICEGANYTLPWGTVVSTAGVYRDTLRSVLGCDSVRRIVTLAIESPVSVTTNAVICQGAVYTLPWGAVVNTAGVYRDTLYSVAGCDSVRRTVNLTVQTAIATTANATICQGQTYTLPWGISVAAPGVYRDTLRSTIGCDSVRRAINLSVQSFVAVTTNPVICQGAVYTLPWGAVVSTAGTYRDTLRYTTGCDSVRRTVNLQVRAAAISAATASICSDEVYVLPWGSVVNTAGIYRDTLKTSLGCDSLIRSVNLTVDPVPTVTIRYDFDYVNCMLGTAKLEASGGVRYAWTPAASLSNAAIYNPVASPSTTTWYRVLVTSDKGCTAEDSVQIKVITGNTDYGYAVPNAFTPNGDGKNDCFSVQHWGDVKDFHFEIYNRWGERIFNTTNPKDCWNGWYKGREENANVFVYQITATGLCGKIYRKGTFTLIR